MTEPAHLALSYFDWMTILALSALAWFLMVRFVRSQDQLAAAVTALSKEVAELPGHIAANYVTKPDHNRDIDGLKEVITDHAERWREELVRHREECPGRRGT